MREGDSGLLLDQGVQRTQRRVRLERVPAGSQFVQDDAEGEQVGGAAHRFAAGLFGRHVACRADQGAGIGGLAGEGKGPQGAVGKQSGHPKIKHLDDVVGPHDQVLGLDVAVDDPGRMSCLQCPRHPGRSSAATGPGRACASTRACKVCPSMNSMTRNGWPSCSSRV